MYSIDAVDAVLSCSTMSGAGIQASSAKLVFWKRHADEIVQRWDRAFRSSDMDKRLILIYVANDVIQVSKPQGKQFMEAFHRLLPEAFKHMLKHSDAAVQKKLVKVVTVWRNRGIWGAKRQAVYDDLVKSMEPGPVKPAAIIKKQDDPLLKVLKARTSDIYDLAQRGHALAEADVAARRKADESASRVRSTSARVCVGACPAISNCVRAPN